MRICPVCTRTFGDAEQRCPDDGITLVALETGSKPGQMDDLTGQVIDGRYKIEGVIGRGGMGMVYACRHVVVGKRLAMKILKPGMERTEDVLARFIREAQAANQVKSQHIAESSDFGQLPSGHFYVVMELLEGMSLAQALKERALSRDQLLFVFAQMADTLAQTHAAGIIHRDLKPDNVYLVRDPHERGEAAVAGPPLFVKLLDFGVAKMMHGEDANLTQSGVILGTPYYMAPEQARGQAIDHRVDIYSLGVMMYHAFTGRLPFIADSAVAVLTAHAIDPPPLPSSVSAVDPGIEQLILRCMEKRPEGRYASMHEVAETLRALRRAGGNFSLPPAQSGAYPRIDTQSGASLSGPYPRLSTMASRVPVEAPVGSGGRRGLLIGASLAMVVLGGVVAVAVFMKKSPSAGSEGGVTLDSATRSSVTSGPASSATPSATTVESAVASSAASQQVTSASAAPSASSVPSSLAINSAGSQHPGGPWPHATPPPPTATPAASTPPQSTSNISGDVRSPFK